jgi:hypothetical protein
MPARLLMELLTSKEAGRQIAVPLGAPVLVAADSMCPPAVHLQHPRLGVPLSSNGEETNCKSAPQTIDRHVRK